MLVRSTDPPTTARPSQAVRSTDPRTATSARRALKESGTERGPLPSSLPPPCITSVGAASRSVSSTRVGGLSPPPVLGSPAWRMLPARNGQPPSPTTPSTSIPCAAMTQMSDPLDTAR
jgi:hypothetical protein